MRKFLVLFSVIHFLSCAKQKNEEPQTGLVGRWLHTEVYVSPGNGGSWQPATNPEPVYMDFMEDGRVGSNHPYYSRFPRYEMRGDTVVMKAFIDSHEREVQAVVEGGKLVVRYACICGCGDKFIRKGDAGAAVAK